MTHKHYHIAHPLSAEVLQAYLRGDLSDQQRRQVVDIIEQHPIYIEVLEGLRWVDEEYPLEERLNALLAQTVKRPTIIRPMRYRWLAIAASLLLLVVAGSLLIRSLQPSAPAIAERAPSDTLPEITPEPITGNSSQESESLAPPPVATPREAPLPPPPTATVVVEDVPEESTSEMIPMFDDWRQYDDEEQASVVEPDFSVKSIPERQQQEMAPANTSLSIEGRAEDMLTPVNSGISAYYQQEFTLAIQLLIPNATTDTEAGQQATYYIGISYAALGNTPAAMEWLDKLIPLSGLYADSARVAIEGLR